MYCVNILINNNIKSVTFYILNFKMYCEVMVELNFSGFSFNILATCWLLCSPSHMHRGANYVGTEQLRKMGSAPLTPCE